MKMSHHKLHPLELPKQDLTQKDITGILYNLTGFVYTFASSSTMRWGKNGRIEQMDDNTFPEGFVQLMPKTTDDGFFDWYGYHRGEQQFFGFKETCALHFINFWLKWVELGRPKAF
jgi:hypothetical protein